MNRLVFKTEIPESRELRIQLPEDAPVGPAEVEVNVRTEEGEKESKLGALLDPKIFGAWKDRTDIDDSVEFARNLRERVWKRNR